MSSGHQSPRFIGFCATLLDLGNHRPNRLGLKRGWQKGPLRAAWALERIRDRTAFLQAALKRGYCFQIFRLPGTAWVSLANEPQIEIHLPSLEEIVRTPLLGKNGTS